MKVIYACLVGDLFHGGHVEFLRQARSLGNYLVVGVCSDEDATHYKRRPVLDLMERAAVIGACRWVDELILAPPSIITLEFLDQRGIDLVVHGDDSTEAQLLHFYGDAIRAGRYRSVPYTRSISTSEVIQRILDRGAGELQRRHFLAS